MRNVLYLLKICINEIVQIIRFWNNGRISTDEQKFSRLRTACHVLDKGLNTVPFEKGHGTAIYKEAKSLHENLSNVFSNDPAFIWSSNVITAYEDAQKSGMTTLCKDAFVKEYNNDDRRYIFDFIRSRISCRNFQKQHIDEHVLEDIVKIAVDAPNGCCRQTVRYYVTQDEDKIKRLVSDVAGITCFSEIPCLVIVTSFSIAYSLIDRNLQYLDASLSAENFVLAARAYNIFSTICNFFHANKKQIEHVRQIMTIPDKENIIMVIAMGYAQKLPQKPVRMSIDKFLFVR